MFHTNSSCRSFRHYSCSPRCQFLSHIECPQRLKETTPPYTINKDLRILFARARDPRRASTLVSRARPSGERRSGDYCQHSVDSAGMLALPIRLQHLPIIALMKYLTPCVLNIEPSLTKPRLRGLTGAAPQEARANGIIQHRSPDTYLASTPNRSPSSPLRGGWTRGKSHMTKACN